MLREYIISEAMNALKIPTTRSLAVVKTGENIIREKNLQGAILTRVASSHIRVGTFQYISARQNINELETLLEFTINRFLSTNILVHLLYDDNAAPEIQLKEVFGISFNVNF